MQLWPGRRMADPAVAAGPRKSREKGSTDSMTSTTKLTQPHPHWLRKGVGSDNRELCDQCAIRGEY
jgi:hypothetical protein